MLAWLTNATKRRIVREIKKILYDHPRYRSDSENVQNKFAFDERPQRGVIVNGTSADRVRLSADNYMGRLSSFCMLVPADGAPCTTVEWVRENFNILEQVSPDRSVFPSAPGVYLFEVKSVPDDARNIPGYITVSPILTVIGEPLITFGDTGDLDAQLSRSNIYPRSVRLWMDNRIALIPDVDFSVNYETGAIRFLKEVPPGEFVHADYRYAEPQSAPFAFKSEQFDISMIPGAVLAFGDRSQECDKFSVVVTDERTDVADVYGGKFEVNFDLIAFSKDSEDREKLSDYIVMKILERQNALGFEGIELMDVSPGGENEDVFNPETDEYFYESSIALSLRVDWSIFVPLPVVLWRSEMSTKASEGSASSIGGAESTSMLVDSAFASFMIGKQDLTFERMRLRLL
jgi:hypothetical protein